MGSFLAELEENQILSADMVLNLRDYIASRNPELSVAMRARIFADALNRMVGSRLPGFNEEPLGKLKELLFRDAATKSVFFIDCSDIFKAAVRLKTLGSEFLDQLTCWLSEVLKKPVLKESLFDLVLQARNHLEAEPEADVAAILKAVEQSMGGLKYAGQQLESAEDLYAETEEREADEDYGSIEWDEGTGPLSEEINIKGKKTLSSVFSIGQQFFPKPKRLLAMSAASVVLLSLFFTNTVPDSSFIANIAKSDVYALNTILPLPSYAVQEISIKQPVHVEPSVIATAGKRMKATAYDLSVESCGKKPGHPLYGITNSGTKATVGRTVAVDPKVIPLGSRLQISFPKEYAYLDGIYIAEDTGRLIQGDKIDIFFGEDREGERKIYKSTMNFGIRYVDVKVLGH